MEQSKKAIARKRRRKQNLKNRRIRKRMLEEGIYLKIYVSGSEKNGYCIQNEREIEEGRSCWETYETIEEAMEEVIFYELLDLFDKRLEEERWEKEEERRRKEYAMQS